MDSPEHFPFASALVSIFNIVLASPILGNHILWMIFVLVENTSVDKDSLLTWGI